MGRVLKQVAPLCAETLIVTRHITEFLEFNVKIVRDLIPGQGPIGGLATGLFYARRPWALVVACDLPFLHQSVLSYLIRKALLLPRGPRALVPRSELGWQPLIALYSRDCLHPARKLLALGGRKLDDLSAHGVIWHPIDSDELKVADYNLDSFININTPEDLAKADRRLNQEQGKDGSHHSDL